MALALLAPDPTGTGPAFRFDLGKNRFWAYTIGKETVRRGDGIETIAEPTFRSPLAGPLPPAALGRGRFEVDPARFDREHRLIQLFSFRTPSLEGPAISPVVTVVPGELGGELPAPAFAEELSMTGQTPIVHTVPFRYREATRSNAMFLDALGGILQSVLPALGGLFGGGSRGGAGGGAAAPPLDSLLRAVTNPETIRAMSELLRQIQAASGGTSAAAPAPSPAVLPAAPSASAMTRALAAMSLDSHARGGLSGRALAIAPRRRLATARGHQRPLPRCREYSEAKVAPALLAVLPALAPLLQQVLKPETVQAVLNAPAQHTQTILNGILDFAKLGMQGQRELEEHLRALNPGTRDPALMELLAAMSVGMNTRGAGADYVRVSSVGIDFETTAPIPLAGEERLAYRGGGSLAFPIRVDTPKTIAQATLQLEIKDAVTLAVRYRRTWRVEQVTTGPLLTVPALSETEARDLRPNTRYLVCAALVWTSGKGTKRGCSRQMEITLLGEYSFDRIEETSELIPLDDVDRFREYWHKIWEASLETGRTRVEMDAKYYYLMKPERLSHARLETTVSLSSGSGRARGRLKSGMELSPTALNRLLPLLSPEVTPLGEAELDALRSPEFGARMSLVARHTADLRGRSRSVVALWVYPEVKLQRVVLQRIGETDQHGQVQSLAEHEVRFPVPALVHFIGTRSP